MEVGADEGQPTKAMEGDVLAEGSEDAGLSNGAVRDERASTESWEGLCGMALWDEYCRRFSGAAMERDAEGYNELEREILFGDASPLQKDGLSMGNRKAGEKGGGSSSGGKARGKGADAGILDGTPTDAVYAAAREILVTECAHELEMTETGREILRGEYRMATSKEGFRAFCEFYDG